MKYMQAHKYAKMLNTLATAFQQICSRHLRALVVQPAIFSLWLSPVLANAMKKINVRVRYHCWSFSPHSLATMFTTLNQMNDSRTRLHLSQTAVPGQSLFFPSPLSREAACCLNFPSNPSLPFPISTLDLQRPALLTKWENRLK